MKKTVIGLSILTLICVSVLLIIDAIYTREYRTCADRIVFAQTFDELQAVSNLIVMARVMPDKENVIHETGYGYTLTQIQIEAVYKGEAAIGDILTVTEEYYLSDDGLGTTLWIKGNYVPAKENQQYIFFLLQYNDSVRFEGMYGIIDLEYGKYLFSDKINSPVDLEKLSDKEIGLGPGPSSISRPAGNSYRDWYKKVLETYK